ncbi:oxaloacetate decarboxylase gamma subunit [Balneicella halophila]|uniref:Oxaloacetate decarboxylase gamma subunit n=1 Tax=Balneicella halophila TaxID=1537566 RepID=A0A7L4UNR5_BALHA|nr:OadG family transporter subunit [Balneicella halophila]PVX50830.1 oxaloacetate decarboxylase gamma subunit [Balneicella halophila]
MILLNVSIGTIALVCMGMVFLVLFFLLLFYTLIPKILDLYFRWEMRRQGKHETDEDENHIPVEGNVNAAIAMALHQYMNELHVEESGIITIEEVKKTYSPWRSKIYSVMNDPRR